jgi:hypothetical protein
MLSVSDFHYKEWTLPLNVVPVLTCGGAPWQIKQLAGSQMADVESKTKPEKERRLGRPRVPPQVARPNRLVTFVTDREMEYLTQVVVEEERSMASVIHRIITAHIAAHTKE